MPESLAKIKLIISEHNRWNKSEVSTFDLWRTKSMQARAGKMALCLKNGKIRPSSKDTGLVLEK